MKTRYLISAPVLMAFVLVFVFAGAQEAQKSHSHEASTADEGASQQVSEQEQAAVETVVRFSAALKAGDLKAVESLFDPELMIFENGGAERSRQEYLSHHASSDAKFLKDAHCKFCIERKTAAATWSGSAARVKYTSGRTESRSPCLVQNPWCSRSSAGSGRSSTSTGLPDQKNRSGSEKGLTLGWGQERRLS